MTATGWDFHALLWNGTPESVTDLGTAIATATNGSQQVGIANGHAVIWSGSAATMVDLHAFLPADFSESQAYAIDSQGNVFGEADGRAVAWMVPEPASLSILGTGIIGLMRCRRRR